MFYIINVFKQGKFDYYFGKAKAIQNYIEVPVTLRLGWV